MSLHSVSDVTTADVAATVAEVVRESTSGRVRELQVTLHRTSVVLAGRASDYYTKQLATRAALDVVADLNADSADYTLTNNILVD